MRVYDGDPPCDDCICPQLLPENVMAWNLWAVLDQHDRPVGFGPARIPTGAMINLCFVYEDQGASFETFEKILMIEKHAFPLLCKMSKADKKEKEVN